MATRIRWTDAERQQVLQKAVEVYHRGSCSYLEALRTAQNLELPTHRLRNMGSHSAVLPETKQLKELLAKTPVAKRVVDPIPMERVTPVASGAAPAPQPSNLSNATMEDLIAEMAKRIADKLTQAIDHEIKTLEHTFKLQKHNPTYGATGIFKKRVVIIGLLQDQQHSIQQEFGEQFQLKFIGTDEAKHVVVSEAHAYLMMKNFISHSVFEKYQKLPNHVLIDGGMSTLRMWLNTKGAEL